MPRMRPRFRPRHKTKRGDRTASCGRRISCGGFRRASGAANSVALHRPATRAGMCRRPLPWRRAIWSSCVPNDHLVLEFYLECRAHALTDVGDQSQHVFGARFAGIDEKIGVAVPDAPGAKPPAFQAEVTEHAASGPPSRTFEYALAALF